MIPHTQKFSVTLSEDYGISIEKTLPFFSGPFQDCLVGSKDLREAIAPHLKEWGWEKGVDALLECCFQLEHKIDNDIMMYIADLRKKGVKCFVVTNNEKYRFQYMLEKMGFKDAFDKTYASGCVGSRKPDQKFFASIYSELDGIQKEEILFFDDAAENVQGAKDFGINAELYTTFEDFIEKIKKYNL